MLGIRYNSIAEPGAQARNHALRAVFHFYITRGDMLVIQYNHIAEKGSAGTAPKKRAPQKYAFAAFSLHLGYPHFYRACRYKGKRG